MPQRPVTAAALPSQQTAGDVSGGGTTSSASDPAPAAPTASGGAAAQIQLSDLQNILSTISGKTGAAV